MKNAFQENVLIKERFSLNRKENELHRKYAGSTENTTPILEKEQN